jgi:SnoaL-like domain
VYPSLGAASIEQHSGQVDVQRTYQSVFAAFPDIVAEVHEYFVQEERVAVRLTVRGSVQGRTFAVPVANYFTVRKGLIESDDGVFDTRGRPCSPWGTRGRLPPLG